MSNSEIAKEAEAIVVPDSDKADAASTEPIAEVSKAETKEPEAVGVGVEDAIALVEKPPKVSRRADKHAAASHVTDNLGSSAHGVTDSYSAIPSVSTNKKLKAEAKDDIHQKHSVASPSKFLSSLAASQNMSAANALSAYSASYLQGLAGFSPYPTLFADPTQNNPFLPTAASFGFGQSTDSLKAQEALLRSLSQASANAGLLGANFMANGLPISQHGVATGSLDASIAGGAQLHHHHSQQHQTPNVSSGQAQNNYSRAALNGGKHDGGRSSAVNGRESGRGESAALLSTGAKTTPLAQILAVRSLSSTEAASLKQLVNGYRESAALLLKSAEELENVLESAGCKI